MFKLLTIVFLTLFATATELKAKEKMEREMVKYYNDNNLLDNSEVKNDKSTDVSDINKSG